MGKRRSIPVSVAIVPPHTQGTCDGCGRAFEYDLFHTGFADAAYAYCDSCGMVAYLSAWYPGAPGRPTFDSFGHATAQMTQLLKPCPCGGSFTATAVPRCPHCQHQLSASAATSWIEANAPGPAKRWRWERSWDGIYCLVIEQRLVKDNWRNASYAHA